MSMSTSSFTPSRFSFVHRLVVRGTSIMLAGLLASCSRTDTTAHTPASGPQPLASIQELMQSIVDPSADALWESVSTTVTAQGEEEKRPRTPEDWRQLRHLAITLSEAGNLLAQPGRVVAHTGQQLEDHHVDATLKAGDIQARIDADPPAFAQFALALQVAAGESLTAIDKQDIEALLRAGSQLDQACEACHQRYWYPGDKRPSQ